MANLEQIKKFLLAQKLPFKTVKLSEKSYTVEDVVKSGVNRADVVKTLVLKTNDGFVALALRGDDRVDFKKIRSRFGSKSELARAEEVLKIVSVPIGAVCPILLDIPLCVDDKVMKLRAVHMGSGDLKYGLEMRLDWLLKAIGDYQTMNFTV